MTTATPTKNDLMFCRRISQLSKHLLKLNQLPIEKRNINRRVLTSSQFAELGHFMLLFSRRRLRDINQVS